MKRIIIAICLIGLISCSTPIAEERDEKEGYSVITIEECEYIEVSYMLYTDRGYYSLTHKGNCKYCTQRNNRP